MKNAPEFCISVKCQKKTHPFFLPNSYNFKSQGVFLIMYDVSKKSVLNFHVCTFFLWCSIAFYNLKVYVMQNGRETLKHAKKLYQYLSWCFVFSWGANVLNLGTLNLIV